MTMEMTMLPFEVLNLILILVATSPDGATTLARVRATCKLLKENVVQSNVLRVVNFQCLPSIDDTAMHHNPYHLLCMCARAGNEVAQTILGKAVLIKDRWLWNMLLGNGPRVVVVDNGSTSSGPIQHPRLVRSFIRHARAEDIVQTHEQLHHYSISFAGYEAYCAHDMFGAISNLCAYEYGRLRTLACVTSVSRNLRANVFCSQNNHMANLQVVIPPYDIGPREKVLAIFDKLFPSTSV